MPSFDAADALNEVLSKKADLASDGRPQISITAAHFVEEALKADKDAFVFPAHAWTPFFGVFGAATGFSSMKEAYQDQEKHIYALETGLSSDPAMNWRISSLDKYALLSNSDMHSLPKMGREMNVFELNEKDVSYRAITKAIKEKDKSKFKMTVEFFPEEGKYHFDGHRQCMVSVDPDTNKLAACPVCGKKLVIGVMHRVNDLADRPSGYVPDNAIPYISLVPLREIIAYAFRKTDASVLVEKTYESMISYFGNEFDVLVNTDTALIKEKSTPEIAQAIKNVRENKVNSIYIASPDKVFSCCYASLFPS